MKKYNIHLVIFIASTLLMTACSPVITTNNNTLFAILELDIPNNDLDNMSLYRFIKPHSNKVDTLIDRRNPVHKQYDFIVPANQKIMLKFYYQENFFEGCDEYLAFETKPDKIYHLKFIKTYGHKLFFKLRSCDILVQENSKPIPVYKNPTLYFTDAYYPQNEG